MKITWDKTKTNAYTAVGDIIEEWANDNYISDFIVHLWTPVLGYSKELFLQETPEKWCWESDWYEGGEYVELIGFIPVSCVDIPPLKEKGGKIITTLADFEGE